MDFFAYLDAGTGSLIIQAIIGGLVGIGVILKVYWGKVVGIFKKKDAGETKKTAEKPSTKSTKVSK
jgi:hypothetical protein